MGFCGRSFPDVYGRAASFLSLRTQAMLEAAVARQQQYVDDLISAVAGNISQTAETFDLTLLFWLLLGPNRSWGSGVVTEGKPAWSGVSFQAEGATPS